MGIGLIMNEVVDRIPSNPGRVLITPEDGSVPYYATVALADNPIQEGTPLNKSFFDSLSVDVNDGVDGFSPTVSENPDNTETDYRLDILNKDGIFTSPNLRGKDGIGADGFSPAITENPDNSKTDYRLNITDALRIFTTPNLIGKDGTEGPQGPKGEKGDPGTFNTYAGPFFLEVDEDGMLYVNMPSEEAALQFEIDPNDGILYYLAEGAEA